MLVSALAFISALEEAPTKMLSANGMSRSREKKGMRRRPVGAMVMLI